MCLESFFEVAIAFSVVVANTEDVWKIMKNTCFGVKIKFKLVVVSLVLKDCEEADSHLQCIGSFLSVNPNHETTSDVRLVSGRDHHVAAWFQVKSTHDFTRVDKDRVASLLKRQGMDSVLTVLFDLATEMQFVID